MRPNLPIFMHDQPGAVRAEPETVTRLGTGAR
jgi:hypothetical protein